MDAKRVAIVLSAFLVVFDYSTCDTVTSPPTNGLFQIGSTFVLSCGIDTLSAGNILQWTEYQTATTGNNICTISTVSATCNSNTYPRYTLATSPGWYNLTISNSVFADGGTYKCWFVLGQTPPVSAAQIVIFDALAINMPSPAYINQSIPVTCTVNYQSAPYFQLLPGAKPWITLTAGTNFTNSSDALVPVNSSPYITITLNETLFVQYPSQLPVNATCTISISNPQKLYYHTVPANIMYPTQTVTISPVKTQYSVNDVISCSANGYPAPTLTWTDVPASGSAQTVPPATLSTSNITFTSGWVGPNHNLTCSAVNPISGSQTVSSSITFTVVDATTDASSGQQQSLAWIAAAVIVPVVVIVAVIVIVVICLKKRKSKQQTKTAQPITMQQSRPTPQYNNNNNLSGSNSPDGNGVRETPFTISKGPTYNATPMGPNNYLPTTNNGQMTPADRRQLTRDSPAGFGALGMNNNIAYPAGPRNLSASFDEGGRSPQLPDSHPPAAPTGRVNSSFAHDSTDLNSSRTQAPGGRINASFQLDGSRVNNNPNALPPSAKVNTSIPQGAAAKPNEYVNRSGPKLNNSVNRSNDKLNDSFPLDGRFTYQPTTRVNDSPDHGGSLNSSISGSLSHNESDHEHGSPKAPHYQPHHQYQPTGVHHNQVIEPDTMV